MSYKHKLSFIGPREIQEAFCSIDEAWDMQVPIESLDDLEQDLNLGAEDCKISKETLVFIFFSRLYNQNPSKFAQLISFLAPYAVCCILIPSADMNQKDEIEQTIKSAQYEENKQYSEYNVNTPFYFCSYENPQDDIYKSIESYVSNNIISEEIKENIRPLLPVNSTLKLEKYNNTEGENNQDEEIIDLPKANPGANGKVITVTSSKGGSGKSTISMLLGSYIAQSSMISAENGDIPYPLKVCIVDLDVRDGQLSILVGSMVPNVTNILMKGAPTPDAIREGIYHSEQMGCDFIFATRRPRSAKRISAEFYAEMIQNLRTMYDVIVLDTSVNYLDELLNQVAYPLADRIVLVSDMGVSSILGMRRWIVETLDDPSNADERIESNKIGIVINKAMPDVNMGPEQIKQAAGQIPVISMVPSMPKLMTYAANTNSLNLALEYRVVNTAIKNIVDQVVDVPLAKLSGNR